ncbi:hypothetical protein KY345_03775 [Candidatus Woesearchaeota archaeon]|nr:hypothetical protein [Candidatus Woesearchaeota archaeon]
MPLSEYDELMYLDQIVPVPYSMPYYDRQSLKEIKAMLMSNAYKEASTIAEHLLFLEHLADKLQQILVTENSAGDSAMILRQQITDIHNLHDTLNSMLQRMNNAS